MYSVDRYVKKMERKNGSTSSSPACMHHAHAQGRVLPALMCTRTRRNDSGSGQGVKEPYIKTNGWSQLACIDPKQAARGPCQCTSTPVSKKKCTSTPSLVIEQRPSDQSLGTRVSDPAPVVATTVPVDSYPPS
jgi:hypothetical protein